ncbi:MAG: GDSL-type esterase/lipase family protein, partial [Armatimonadota bacterium]
MKRAVHLLAGLMMCGQSACVAEVVRLKATADVWLSDATENERGASSGKHARLKLKTIQEMAAIRFDAAPSQGREVVSATLFMRRASDDKLRYVRVSTVNQDWEEGDSAQAYGAADGATYLRADHASGRSWAWPGSCFADVIMTSGNSLATWAERKELPDEWISVALTPELIYAMAAGDTDGLAVMDGGNLSYHNNFIHSVQSAGNEPYIEVELGRPLTAAPPRPLVKVEPASERAHINAGALKVTIEEAKDVFCWRLTLNGKPVERWRVKHPVTAGPTVFYLEDLPPSQKCELEVVAVSPGGRASPPARMTAIASPALSRSLRLGELQEPRGGVAPPTRGDKMRVWACPGLVKISPERPEALHEDVGGEGDYRRANAVWDGRRISVFGARGEYVSYQLCVENLGSTALTGIKVSPRGLDGPEGATIGRTEIELYKNWYAQNRDDRWQPAYCVPTEHGAPFQIPDAARALPGQQNQTIYVDIYIPKDAKPGDYSGAVAIEAEGAGTVSLPVELTVFDFVLPDRLSFWPELNAYRIPRGAHAYYRLAHQHRCVVNYWRWQPRLRGSGKDIEVIWDRYDENAGPLLTGEAFAGNRRSGAPVECMYLPFEDSWPTRLSTTTYNYQGHWPGRGESRDLLTQHYLTAPYIGDALSQEYKDAFLAVQRQFIEHFEEKGYTRTEMQCFYGGKNTHRINYGSNMWWTTDEPYHWDDWLALQFFCRLWAKGRGDADPRRWLARADISRPQWQGRVLDGIVNTVYFGTGAFSSPPNYRRCRILAQDTGLKLMTYGSANRDTESNTGSVVWILNAWTNGANGVLPWQTLGNDKALDKNDGAMGGGNAMLVPGERFGLEVVGDMRLKALREAQQIVEYLTILAERRNLQREQIKAMVHRAIDFGAGTRAGAGADNADALQFSTLKAWQISELRRRVAELILGTAPTTAAATEAPAEDGDDWVEAMKPVHAKFTGQQGTVAQFGDSITITMAFFVPLQMQIKNVPEELRAAHDWIRSYVQGRCWRGWKGPQFGNQGQTTTAWAVENIGGWLEQLNPEVALVMWGTNDTHKGPMPPQYTENLRVIVQKCLDNGTIPILYTIPPRGTQANNPKWTERVESFVEAARTVAAEKRVPLIDFYEAIMSRQPTDFAKTLLGDAAHPSYPEEYRRDFSEEALRNSGYTLRNYVTLKRSH